ncbi:jg10380 [Pararge aegeria aegeria]|uniref:Jg10380 protein n=1 Tax=Pararge aegeria aegeria TaxID=348720 RepID=A0A8S4SCJ1_9NEOP|nr:jg10380 [Pararge aegeria aegeria]
MMQLEVDAFAWKMPIHWGKWKLEGHSRSLWCESETRIQSASYASVLYQPPRDADPYGASRFDGWSYFCC